MQGPVHFLSSFTAWVNSLSCGEGQMEKRSVREGGGVKPSIILHSRSLKSPRMEGDVLIEVGTAQCGGVQTTCTAQAGQECSG